MIVYEQKLQEDRCMLPPITEMAINQLLIVIDDLLREHDLEIGVEQFGELTTSFWIRKMGDPTASGGHRVDTSKLIPV